MENSTIEITENPTLAGVLTQTIFITVFAVVNTIGMLFRNKNSKFAKKYLGYIAFYCCYISTSISTVEDEESKEHEAPFKVS